MPQQVKEVEPELYEDGGRTRVGFCVTIRA